MFLFFSFFFSFFVFRYEYTYLCLFVLSRLPAQHEDEKTPLMINSYHSGNYNNYGNIGNNNATLIGNFTDSAYLNRQVTCFVGRKRVFVVAIVIFVIYLIVALACGWNLDHC